MLFLNSKTLLMTMDT